MSSITDTDELTAGLYVEAIRIAKSERTELGLLMLPRLAHVKVLYEHIRRLEDRMERFRTNSLDLALQNEALRKELGRVPLEAQE